MAGTTIEQAKQIIHDIRHSWYFRFWAVFWLVGVLVTFSALIILSRIAHHRQEFPSIQTWIENASSIQFPDFHFHLHGNEIFTSFSCSYGNSVLQAQACDFNHGGYTPAQNQCIAISGSSVVAYNQWVDWMSNRVLCAIQTSGSGPQHNLIMSFNLEGQYVAGMTGGAFQSTYLGPNNNVWIMLEKGIYQENHNQPEIQLWQKSLLYHSTVSQAGFYNVSVIMGSFLVNHWAPVDQFTGWMDLGSIGGVGFFMVLLQTGAMVIFGIVLANTSTFLTGAPTDK